MLLSTGYVPAHAQATDGTLVDIGEGDSRILTSEWGIVNPGESVTYQFVYNGEEQPVSVWMNSIPAGGAAFQIWTDERLEEFNENPDTEPLGQGTAMADNSGFLNWQGGSPEAETYYVVVSATGDAAARYLLNVSSPALAPDQPGAVGVDETPVEPVVPAEPVDPNVAFVTTTALNVRSGPSTAYPVLVTIPNGTQMTVLGRNAINTWINVQLEDGTEGWVTRSLTSYALISPNVITPEVLPPATVTETTTTTDTTTAPAPVAATPTVTATELGGAWQVLGEDEIAWYTFQYRGGDLPLTVWMDVEPFNEAQFTVVNAETAQAMMAGTIDSPATLVGRGRSNPVEPGYLYWQADFAEADVYYVMVEADDTVDGDVFYAIYALGPGVGRVIEPVVVE
jgi:SH3-like domain-containing protein